MTWALSSFFSHFTIIIHLTVDTRQAMLLDSFSTIYVGTRQFPPSTVHHFTNGNLSSVISVLLSSCINVVDNLG